MPQITKLKAQKRSQRVNVYLDGKYATSLDLISVTKLGLKVGMIISSKKFNKLVNTHRFEKLYNKVIHFLSYRPRSEKEIKDYLKGKLHSEESKEQHQKILEKVIVKLKRQGLVNDKQFTSWWIAQRQQFRPKSKRLLMLELRQKGIDLELIKDELTKVNEFDAALKLVKKKMKSYQKLESREIKQKLRGLLSRRGFAWDTIKSVVDELSLQE
jgi:regulatory protein